MPTMSLPPKSTPHMIWYRPFLAEVYLTRLLASPSQLSDSLAEGVVVDGVVDGVVVVEGVMAAMVVELAGLRTAPQTASLWTAGIWSFLR